MLGVIDLIASDEVDTLEELLIVFKCGAFLNLTSHYNDNKLSIFANEYFRIGKTIRNRIIDSFEY